ncbi:MAG: HAD family hydrolase [Candidatus Izemoplasmataceae bacterium]|jgi:5-amino-6-(5-phospho-D-ribitylamino)uracil phosphatase|uniref:HAD family hydrolase n=1 Tax=Liberiplasma polymorphum TaxID=3374570 RepID=UPI0037768D50
MKKYLIALDLDGTLLYDWETLKEETVNYLKKVQDDGHTLVIATGRPFRSSERYYTMLNLDTPIINYNGGLVSWRGNDTFKEVSLLLDKNDVIDIFEKNKEHIYNGFCELKDDIYLLEKTDDIMPLLHFFNGATLNVGPFSETLPEGTNGFIIVAHKNHGQYIEDYVKKHYEGKILTRNWGDEYNFIIELFTPQTNKGEALKYVAETLGFNQEDVIAFGDGHNDIEMLEYAGVGIAMRNSHPELIEVADVVSPYSNKEFAIEKFLDEFLKK